MKTLEVGGLTVNAPEDMPEEEIQQYVSRARQKYGNNVHGISLKIAEDDKDFVEITYDTPVRPFHRLRRITGKPTK